MDGWSDCEGGMLAVRAAEIEARCSGVRSASMSGVAL